MTQLLCFEGFVFDPETHELSGPDGVVPLAPTPARLLAELTSRPGQVVSRADLWVAIWPDEKYDLDQRLNYTVHHLRRALGDDPAAPRFVQTLPRRGYRFVADVRREDRRLEAVRTATTTVGPLTPSSRPRRARIPRALRWGLLAAGVAMLWPAIDRPVSESARPSAPDPTRDAPTAPGRADAIEATRVGRHLLQRGRDGDLTLAESYFREAIEVDSAYALAWVGLAATREDQGDRLVATLLLERAAELDPDLPELRSILGRHAIEDGRWGDARRHYLAASASAPDEPGPQRALAHHAVMIGRPTEALAHIEQARRLAPGEALDLGDTGWIYYWAGDPRRAIQECAEHERIRGTNPLARACLFSAYTVLGEIDDAADIARLELADAGLNPSSSTRPEDVVDAFLDWRASVLDGVEKSHYARARIAAMRGDPGGALNHLLTAAAQGETATRYLLAEPLFADLRSDPRFDAVRVEVGLPRPARSAR